MYTQKVFQAGNSLVIAIPKEILRRLNLKVGDLVTLDVPPDNSRIIIKKLITDKSNPKEDEWLKTFMKENSDILDELAKGWLKHHSTETVL